MKVGDTIKDERLGICTIQRIHPAGTIDVEDSRGKWFRVTGLTVGVESFPACHHRNYVLRDHGYECENCGRLL